jgi:hypothetical protein
VGGTDKITLKLEKAKAPTNIPIIIMNKFIDFHRENISVVKINGGNENTIPNRKDPQISPINIVLIEIGHVISLSSVFCLVSQGKTTGPIEAAVKNKTIASKPEVK